MRLQTHVLPTLALTLATAACSGVLDDNGDGGDKGMCPSALPAADIVCTDSSCNVTTGTKTFAQAELTGSQSPSWLAVTWVSSEINTNDNINVDYQKATAGALTARRAAVRERARDRHTPAELAALYAPRLDGRVQAESALRAEWPKRLDPNHPVATGIRGRTAELLPDGVHRQGNACSRSNPVCGETAVCLITNGAGDGTCESAMTIKLRAGGQNADIAASVKKVGTYAAILVDDADTVPDSAVDELLQRFDTHIAPTDHMFFGEPKTAEGQDFDGNGVVLVMLTSKVGDISSDLVGFFYAPDMEDPAQNPDSNGADMLYMRPPDGAISVDAVSSTLGHEYQHLINFLAKTSRGSSPEETWLDEGLATFAEDVLGYGADDYTNIARYLDAVSETSLTGFGLTHSSEGDADSIERRGMASLFVRTIFERNGGADLGLGAGELTDHGGVAQVKKLVQTPSTGVDVISRANTGKSLHEWLGILLTTVALDGTRYPMVSCNPAVQFAEPKTSAYTGFQIGIDLRSSFTDFSGATIMLHGPATATFEMESVPVPSNGGEVRTVQAGTGTVDIGVGGPAEDYQLGLSAFPTAL